MTTVQVETSPFAMFPAQGDYSNTDTEKREALRALLPWASNAAELRTLAESLGIIDPTPEPDTPVLCPQGHDQEAHGRKRGDGRRYCAECARQRSEVSLETNTINAAGTRRRLRHLLLNGFTQRHLARVFGISAQSISRITGERVKAVKRDLAHQVTEFFDRNRDEFHVVAWNDKTANARKNWVWAELYEDLDDPLAEPVVPGRVAA